MDKYEAKIPIIKINKELEKFKGKILFPEKLKLANELLKNAILPEKLKRNS